LVEMVIFTSSSNLIRNSTSLENKDGLFWVIKLRLSLNNNVFPILC